MALKVDMRDSTWNHYDDTYNVIGYIEKAKTINIANYILDLSKVQGIV